MNKFKEESLRRISGYAGNKYLLNSAQNFMHASIQSKYSYNFFWLSRPIIQYPQDIVALQEIIWLVKPDLIIETGIAHGGSLIFYASMLTLLDICDAIEREESFNPKNSSRKVLGIDIEIRPHNRKAIESHPMFSRIHMIEGSSTSDKVIAEVYDIAKNFKKIMVCLDSNHTHEHVLAELEAYAPLVSPGSYCVVFDTLIDDMPKELFPDRPWGPGNNPKTAVWEYLRRIKEEGRLGADGFPLKFEIDKNIEYKLLITVSPDGYLKRVNV